MLMLGITHAPPEQSEPAMTRTRPLPIAVWYPRVVEEHSIVGEHDMVDNYVIAQTRLSFDDGESTSIDFLRNNLCHIYIYFARLKSFISQ
jgi:hypothetical protein